MWKMAIKSSLYLMEKNFIPKPEERFEIIGVSLEVLIIFFLLQRDSKVLRWKTKPFFVNSEEEYIVLIQNIPGSKISIS